MKSSQKKEQIEPQTPPRTTTPPLNVSQSKRDAIILRSSTGIKMRHYDKRTSIIIKYHRALIDFVPCNKRQTFHQSIKINDEQELKQKELYQQVIQIQQENQNQNQRIKNLLQIFRMNALVKQNNKKQKKQYIDQYNNYLRSKQNTRSILCDQRIRNVHLKQKRQQNYTKMQGTVYQIVSHMEALQNQLKQAQINNQKTNISINKSIEKIKLQQEKINIKLEEENAINEEYREIIEQIEKIFSIKNQHDLHLSILKIQFNPEIRIGFITEPESSIVKKDALGKERWPKEKQIKLSIVDVKHFIILQLYNGWKKMMRISYKSSHYAILMGYKFDDNLTEHIKRLIVPSESKATTKRKTKMIVFYSEKASRKDEFKSELEKSLRNFNNQLIRIEQIEFTDGEDSTQNLTISYSYLDSVTLHENFSFKFKDNISKEEIMRTISGFEKRLVCLIEIPMFTSKEQNKVYSEIYDMIRKNKKLC